MADYYLKGQTGNDSTGDGSSGAPWKTFSKAKTVLTNLGAGDTLHCAEDCFEIVVWTGNSGRIQQWVGQTQCRILGAVALPASGWTNVAGNRWTINLGAGLNGADASTPSADDLLTAGSVGSATSRWSANVDSDGHYGHLKRVGTAAAVIGDDYSWHYDNVTGLQTMDVGSEPSPNGGGGAEYFRVVRNTPLFDVRSAANLTVYGLQFGLVAGAAAGAYLVYCDGTGNLFDTCTFDDGGNHAIAWGVGTNESNGCVNCTFRGQYPGGILGTHYSSSGNVTGGYYRNCTFVQFTYRDPTGAVIDATASCGGVYAHTDGAGGRVVSPGGVVVDGCVFTRPFGNPGNDINVGNVADVTADSAVMADYPMAAVDCVFSDVQQLGDQNTYFRQCSIIRASALAANNTPIWGASTNKGVNQGCFIACFIAVNLYAAASNERSIFYLRNANSAATTALGGDQTTLVLINNTICDVAALDSYWPRIITWNGGALAGKIIARGNVFAGKQGAGTKGWTFSQGDGAITSASGRFDFAGNWYFGWDATYGNRFSDVADRAIETSWDDAIDTAAEHAVYSTDPQIASPSTSPEPTGGGNLATSRQVETIHASVGVNGRPYRGLRGSWQDGGNPNVYDSGQRAFAN